MSAPIGFQRRGEPGVVMLSRARAAGVSVSRASNGGLAIDAAPGESAADLAELVRVREQQVLALFDWRRAVVTDPESCLLCARPALLRDPADHLPVHKACVDTLLCRS